MRTLLGTVDCRWKRSCNPLDLALSCSISSRLSSKRCKSKQVSFRITRPASIFDISSTSLIRVNKCSPLRLIIPRLSRCSALNKGSLLIISVNPRMALSGVRSSWLIFARNSLLAWLARSAVSFASWRALACSWVCASSSVCCRATLSWLLSNMAMLISASCHWRGPEFW